MKIDGIFLVLLVVGTCFELSRSQPCNFCDNDGDVFANSDTEVVIPGFELPGQALTCSLLELAAAGGFVPADFCEAAKVFVRPPCLCPGDPEVVSKETCVFCEEPFSNPDAVIAIDPQVQPTCAQVQDYGLGGLTTEQCDLMKVYVDEVCTCPVPVSEPIDEGPAPVDPTPAEPDPVPEDPAIPEVSEPCHVCDTPGESFLNQELEIVLPSFDIGIPLTCGTIEQIALMGLIAGDLCADAKTLIRPPCLCAGDPNPPVTEPCNYCAEPFSNPDTVIFLDEQLQPSCEEIQTFAAFGLSKEQCDLTTPYVEENCVCPEPVDSTPVPVDSSTEDPVPEAPTPAPVDSTPVGSTPAPTAPTYFTPSPSKTEDPVPGAPTPAPVDSTPVDSTPVPSKTEDPVTEAPAELPTPDFSNAPAAAEGASSAPAAIGASSAPAAIGATSAPVDVKEIDVTEMPTGKPTPSPVSGSHTFSIFHESMTIHMVCSVVVVVTLLIHF